MLIALDVNQLELLAFLVKSRSETIMTWIIDPNKPIDRDAKGNPVLAGWARQSHGYYDAIAQMYSNVYGRTFGGTHSVVYVPMTQLFYVIPNLAAFTIPGQQRTPSTFPPPR